MPKPSALAVALRLAPSINNAIWPSEDIDIKSTSATRKHVPGLTGRRQGKHRRAIASLLPIELGSLRPKRAGNTIETIRAEAQSREKPATALDRFRNVAKALGEVPT